MAKKKKVSKKSATKKTAKKSTPKKSKVSKPRQSKAKAAPSQLIQQAPIVTEPVVKESRTTAEPIAVIIPNIEISDVDDMTVAALQKFCEDKALESDFWLAKEWAALGENELRKYIKRKLKETPPVEAPKTIVSDNNKRFTASQQEAEPKLEELDKYPIERIQLFADRKEYPGKEWIHLNKEELLNYLNQKALEKLSDNENELEKKKIDKLNYQRTVFMEETISGVGNENTKKQNVENKKEEGITRDDIMTVISKIKETTENGKPFTSSMANKHFGFKKNK